VVAILLALGASLGWGASDFLGGWKSRTTPLLSVLLVVQATSVALLGVAVLTSAGAPPAAGYLAAGVLSGFAELAGGSALYRGLAVGRMSVVAPISAAAPAVPLVAGLVIGEVPEPVQNAGLVLIVLGIVFASRASDATGPVGPSVGYGLVSAAGFGAFYVAMDAASEGGLLWALLISRGTAMTVIVATTLAARHRLRVGGKNLPVLVGIGVLATVGDAMYATATTLGLLGVVAVLAALHSVVTIGLARFFLHERVAAWQQAGIVGCLSGVAVLAAA
jgi:drug/metabolite transporter (DMT)-like permease